MISHHVRIHGVAVVMMPRKYLPHTHVRPRRDGIVLLLWFKFPYLPGHFQASLFTQLLLKLLCLSQFLARRSPFMYQHLQPFWTNSLPAKFLPVPHHWVLPGERHIAGKNGKRTHYIVILQHACHFSIFFQCHPTPGHIIKLYPKKQRVN